MKLNLLFIVMELLTLSAYPLVLIYGKLHQFSKTKQGVPVTNSQVTVPIKPGR